MTITARFLTDPQYSYDCARWTSNKPSKELTVETFQSFLESEHSPIRACILEVNMFDIPYFSSVHFTRHKIGVEHYVTSNRPDRAGKERSVDDKVNHRMVINCQALISMARRRLCYKASAETRSIMLDVQQLIADISEYGQVLSNALMPDCRYRKHCHELKSCGWYERNAK